MPVSEAASLVARFLRANHYDETLNAFLQEAGLPEDAGALDAGLWTIEQILQEKKQFDSSVNYEKAGNDTKSGWSENAPGKPYEPEISINSNVLCVNASEEHDTILATCADKTFKSIASEPPYAPLGPALSNLNDSPILSTVLFRDLMLSTSMSGHLALRKAKTRLVIDECRHHSKYAVQVVNLMDDDIWIVATAGWDQRILFYTPDRSKLALNIDSKVPGLLGEPVHSETFPSNPESMILVRHPDTRELYLVASRRDSTHLYYYHIKSSASQVTIHPSGRQNLAPHSNAWVAFTPCSLNSCPGDPTLVAVATSQLPHMKVIIVRLLFPSESEQSAILESGSQAAAARASLALQDREDAAIRLHVTTMAPQTPYSTPQVVWRPDGTGLFVNGDDGVIRGIESSTGKVITMLHGHEPGSKVRTLWAGNLRNGTGTLMETLVSGGFDRKLIIWTT